MGGSKVRRFRYGCPLLSAGSPLSAPILAQHALRSLRLFMAHDAKHLFVAANVAGGRTEIDRTATDARATSGVLGWDPVQPPVPVQGVPLAH
jgi:hypothetical protein